MTSPGAENVVRISDRSGELSEATIKRRLAALDGTTAVLGAPYHDGAASDSGSASVFVSNGANWSFQQNLAPLDPSGGDLFGFSVRVQDERVVVGARLDDAAGGRDSGSGYVFESGSQATWAQSARLNPADAASADEFGDAALVVTSPTGTSSDLLLALVRQRKTTGTVAAPGWTLIRQDGTSARSSLFYKVAGSSEPVSYTFTTNVAGDLEGHYLGWLGPTDRACGAPESRSGP
ncbi:MAG: hypothetical protein ACRD0Q_05460 [Acidimicrobiales bacterium]